MVTFFTIILIIFLLLLLFFIYYFLPIIITDKILNLNLSLKRKIYTFFYFVFIPISLLFSVSYYRGLKNDGNIEGKKGFFKMFFLILFLAITFSISFDYLRDLYFKPFQVSGQSMYPNYYDREFLLSKKENEYKRGDVIIFYPPGKDLFFIKRIIGLPGETIKIENGKVFLFKGNNYEELNENYLTDEYKNRTFVKGNLEEYIYKIPENSYFVLGDNREKSVDSIDCFGTCGENDPKYFITKDDIVGKIYFDLGHYDFKKGDFVSSTGENSYPKFLNVK